jgi:hypothetical protein
MSSLTYITEFQALFAAACDKEAVKQSIYTHLYSATTQRRAAPLGVSSKDAEILALTNQLEDEDPEILEEVCSELTLGDHAN